MRIVHIITRSDIVGGASIHVRDLSRGLQDQGHFVTVLVGGEGPVSDALREYGIPVRSVPNLVRAPSLLRDLAALRELISALKELQPDVVCTHTAKAGWLGRIAARYLKLPVTYTAHGWSISERLPITGGGIPGIRKRQGTLFTLAERVIAPLTDVIINVSDSERRLALSKRIGRPDQHVTVHNGMPDVGAELQSDPSHQPPRIIMVARFDLPKDHDLLVGALAELKTETWELELVGNGPRLNSVAHAAQVAGIDSRTHLSGEARDVARRLSDAQIFVLATNFEGFSLSILEAMRCGLPIVASDVGGVREAVSDGVNGFVTPRGDRAALRRALQLLIADPALRTRMGEASRSIFARQFTLEQMLSNTCTVYRSVLTASNPSIDFSENRSSI
jgi:glycosyltransferase involved in cell wall biosynthesis